MSEMIKLRNLCTRITDGSHYSPLGVEKGYPMLSVKDMGSYDFNFDNCKYISEDEYQSMLRNDCVPKKNDIVIAKDGSYLKEIFVITEDRDIAILSSIGILRPNLALVDPYYLKYYLSSDYVRKLVGRKYVTGSALQRIILENFGDIDIPYVSLDRQHAIVALLKNIDSKIANNNAICFNLEAMAKLLYDYWFVQFDFPDENGKPYKSSGGKMVWNDELKREIPEGWEVRNLYHIADFVNGLACQKYRPKDNKHKLPVIKIGEMHNGFGSDVEWARDDVPEKNVVMNGDILFSWSASLEVMLWKLGTGVLNQHIFKVIPKAYDRYYVYRQLSSYIINFVKMADARKTTMGHITTDHLTQSRIAIPPKSVAERYGSIVSPLYEELIGCSCENQQLASLRDFLLPMLMNGQVKVG